MKRVNTGHIQCKKTTLLGVYNVYKIKLLVDNKKFMFCKCTSELWIFIFFIIAQMPLLVHQTLNHSPFFLMKSLQNHQTC